MKPTGRISVAEDHELKRDRVRKTMERSHGYQKVCS
jgi:hypothetical protein